MNSTNLTLSMQHNEQWNFLGIIFGLVCLTGEPHFKIQMVLMNIERINAVKVGGGFNRNIQCAQHTSW